MKFLGIDPGLTGGYALIDHTHHGDYLNAIGNLPTLETAKGKRALDTHALVRLIIELGHVDTVAVERVGTRPGQGIASAFKFGFGAGTIEGALIALARPLTYLRPTEWHKLVGYPVGAGKDWGRRVCMERWPVHADEITNDGRSDAALIALAAINRWTGRKEAAA